MVWATGTCPPTSKTASFTAGREVRGLSRNLRSLTDVGVPGLCELRWGGVARQAWRHDLVAVSRAWWHRNQTTTVRTVQHLGDRSFTLAVHAHLHTYTQSKHWGCHWNFSIRGRRSFWYIGVFKKVTQPRLQIACTIWSAFVSLCRWRFNSRVAVDMKFLIHIHIHRYCVDIHGYSVSISIDACSVWMYTLIADKAQLVSTSYSSLLKIYKNENKMFAAILMKQKKVPTSCVLCTYTCTCTRTYTNAVVTCKLCQTVFSAVSIRTRSQALARTPDRTASYYLVISDCCIASPAVFEILRCKRIGVTSLTFWRHRSRDHLISRRQFPIGGPLDLEPSHCL